VKIIHVAGDARQAAQGSAHECIRPLALAQDARGDDAQVLWVAGPGLPGANDVTAVSIRRVGARGHAGRAIPEPRGGHADASGLPTALLAERNVEVLHCHAARSLGPAVRSAAQQRRIPYVLHLHGGDAEWPETGAGDAAGGGLGRLRAAILGSRRILADAGLVLVASDADRERVLTEKPRGRVEILPRGVDAARFRGGNRARGRLRLGLPADATVLLTIAPIDPGQNQEVLVDVLVAEPNAHAVLAGPVGVSGYDDRIRIRARAFGVEARLCFASAAALAGSDVPDLYAASDVLVLPSAKEACPSIVLEAWAACLPVIAANSAGFADLRSGNTGLFVPAGDGKALAAAVARVLGDETLRGGFAGRGARLVAIRYDWAAVAARVDVLYREAGAGKPG
jgi:glycosyltransferase involved in cell wall biosynthesis